MLNSEHSETLVKKITRNLNLNLIHLIVNIKAFLKIKLPFVSFRGINTSIFHAIKSF